MSEAAFTLSTTAQASPAATSRLSSGSSTNTTSPNCSCAWSVMPTVAMSPSSTHPFVFLGVAFVRALGGHWLGFLFSGHSGGGRRAVAPRRPADVLPRTSSGQARAVGGEVAAHIAHGDRRVQRRREAAGGDDAGLGAVAGDDVGEGARRGAALRTDADAQAGDAVAPTGRGSTAAPGSPMPRGGACRSPRSRPASTGVVSSSMSLPYRQSPASSRSESRAPSPAGATSGCAASIRSANASARSAGTRNLEPVLAGVAGARDQAGDAADLDRAHAHEGQLRRIRRQPPQHRGGCRPLQRQQRAVFEHGEAARRPAGWRTDGRNRRPCGWRSPPGRTVSSPRLATIRSSRMPPASLVSRRVALPAGLQPDDVARHQPLQRRRRGGAGQHRLAHVGDVEQRCLGRQCRCSAITPPRQRAARCR